ncbi:MBL fold hydrolase [Candidatus Dojkabacteria bacterium CG_4_9_14_3_um_filter_150_Dojkabacteria_WS6_41_13]|uniref:MBL fold hydrolase n=1 Tax=Candidatus Dojkabacteria bacterium CG_4_10_14_0_2_um_filter_Dojkabacteria_WS6_41_15 TaxID=2014249 RepID=A0A2M7W1F6_9BACT|nr:MAG: MBL fold hydrolase [Candidatus Dojkabacteria bacterium CG_4_10_14_0_2_um_filter_Dojkabacteria_WS6_41_15]PJB23977.1 MAG: MBL fold hydrolase [Candidatus Dojkabacteria bacterium CG_4_9_14_3_um_filter_150_Dojkabacteria_WS6_41_13]
MKIKFSGATGGIVTGSSYLLETGKTTVLVDCGMYQGEESVERLNFEPFPFDPAHVDYILLTHAHLDHVGLLPKLVNNGFAGKIISTDATKSIAEIIMMDAAKLQEEDAYYKNEKSREKSNTGGGEEGGYSRHEPLYTRDDIAAVMELFETYPIGEQVKLTPDLAFRMREAGHILGAVAFEVWYMNTQGRERKLVMSGDLGQTGARIIKDPDFIREADYVIIESTYGGRNHRDKNSTLLELLAILQDAALKKSRVIIPTFAVERTQELLYEINLFVERKLLKGLKFYVDSPLAIKATEIFRAYKKYYDEDAMALVNSGDDPFAFRGLEYTENANDSRRIAGERGAVIMAGSGMCTGGRVLHHLMNTLPHKDAHIVFVGFQVPGTLGRRIIDGARTVRIHGVDVEVNAQIHTLNGFSAHADQHDLLYWLRSFGHSPKEVFITHGDQMNRTVFAQLVRDELQLNAVIPEPGQEFELE